ncbi:hypothetical protein GCM10023213_34850 [Prosthecobacter algae]|uniref:Uncharacterized protein n=2 Tax=Prosthecobacter algae TaxID=1144682 RepID=A0ABP9PCX1_9BACT
MLFSIIKNHLNQCGESLIFQRFKPIVRLVSIKKKGMSANNQNGANGGTISPRRGLSAMSPGQRPRGLSPRAYQARVDLCRLWDLMMQGSSAADIARTMGKDPAWVSRSIKRIKGDFSTVYERPAEKEMVNDHLARLETLYAKAMKAAEESEGMAKVAAIRTVNSILRDKAQFLQFVGLIYRNQEDHPVPFSMESFFKKN